MHMRPLRGALIAAGLVVPLAACAVPPFQGNDTGGIMAYSPDADRARHQLAQDHCARYKKLHRITSVHRQYGDYIAFQCYWPRGTGPAEVILRRAY